MGRPRISCPEALLSLLGVITDQDIAERARVSTPTVRRWRRDQGTAAHCGPRADHVAPADVRAALEAFPGVSWADRARACDVSRQRMSQALRHGLAAETLAAWTAVPLDAWILWRTGAANATDGQYLFTGVAQGHAVRTSPLITAEGARVRTQHTYYKLGAPAADYVAWCAALGVVIDAETPLLLTTAMPWPQA